MKVKIFIAGMALLGLSVSGVQAEGLKEYKARHLPEWLELGGEIRHRYEHQENFDFNDAVDDDSGFNLWRSRFNITIKPSDELKFFYQFQDSRISHDSLTGSKTSYENWIDHNQLWLEAASDRLEIEAIGLTRAGLRIGRQEFSIADNRLVGVPAWGNVPTTFDGAMAFFDFADNHLKLNVFGGNLTAVKSPREMDDFYSGDENDRLAAYEVIYTGLKKITISQYVIRRDTEGKTVSFGQTGDGAVEDYTIGAYVKGRIGETSWDFEAGAAKQIGDSGTLDVDAEMLTGIIGYTFKHDWKPRVAFEFDYASGDSNPSDGKRETFDNLYPSNHQYYTATWILSACRTLTPVISAFRPRHPASCRFWRIIT